jgi:hypothetical protein
VESLFFWILNYLYRARIGGSLGSCGGARSPEEGGGGWSRTRGVGVEEVVWMWRP